VAGRFEPGCDRMLLRSEFEKLQSAVGRPFSLEGAGNVDGSNCHVSTNFCSEARPFEHTACRGQNVYLNGPFDERLAVMLSHYCQEKLEDPYNTSGCFVVPRWRGAPWVKYLQGMHVIAHYPKGSKIFAAVNAFTGEREVMPGIPWEVMVYWDPPKKRPCPRVRVHAVVQADSRVSMHSSVSMEANGTLGGKPCTVLFDSGCREHSFVSATFAQQAGLIIRKSAVTGEVAVADGREMSLLGVVKARLKVGDLREQVELMVAELDPSLEVVLGGNWLTSHRAMLNYESAVVHAKSGNKRVEIPANEWPDYEGGLPTAAPLRAVLPHKAFLRKQRLLSVLQVRRLAQQNRRMFVVVVRETDESAGQQLSNEGIDAHTLLQQPPKIFGDGLADESAVNSVTTEFADVFADPPPGLPPERGTAHTIEIVEGAKPPCRPAYRLSPAERAEVEKQVKYLLEMGYVVPSRSPFGAPILFVPKPDGSLRMCIDYRALNAITVKNKSTVPRADDLIDSLAGAKVFSALDLAAGYWQVRLAEGEPPKTAFRTHFGSFEWRVLPFGLTNAVATFQTLMNDLFQRKGYLNKFVLVYLDDILIYSRTAEEHLQHLRMVFEVLREARLYCRREKCHFNKRELKYLGHIVGADGIKPDTAKLQAVGEYPRPRNVTEVRSFLGLATYFRRFIQGFSVLARPLHALTRTAADVQTPAGAGWCWDERCEAAFLGLKDALVSAPVLALPDYDAARDGTSPFEVVCDASIHGVGAVLLQAGHPVAYESQKFNSAAYNYDTGEQEMLAVVYALQKFRCYVEGTHFRMVSDHEPLTFFNNQPRLSRKQARWYEFLQTFDFRWEHRPGRINVADPLSRIPGVKEFVSAAVVRGRAPRYRRYLLCAARARSTPAAAVVIPLESRVAAAYARDPAFAAEGPARSGLTRERGLWWKGGDVAEVADVDTTQGDVWALAIPDVDTLREECIALCHDSPIGGHFGVKKTLHLLGRSFWWPGMAAQTKQYVQKCRKCQENRSPTQAPSGELSPLPTPTERWKSVSLDFVVKLPKSARGNDSILVVVDRFSKYVLFEPCKETITAEGLVETLTRRVVAEKGYPRQILSDRDGRVTAALFQEWAKKFGVELRTNTSYHSRANGQAERFNLVMENYLRAFVDPAMSNWDELLPIAQLAINNSYQESVQNTPFYLEHGRHPYIPGVTTLKRALVVRDERAAVRRHWQKPMRQVLAKAQESLKLATDRAKRRFDVHRRQKTFEPGDKVLLSTRNLKFKGVNCKKLGPRFIGPYTVEEQVGNVSYKLALPDCMEVHPIFHVELLREYKGADFVLPPAIECEDGTLQYEVEAILKQRGRGHSKQLMVRWLGYTPEWDTWEPRSELMKDVPNLVLEFEAKQQNMPAQTKVVRRKKKQ